MSAPRPSGMLERGRLPPIGEGFTRFLGAAPIETLAASLAERERAAQTEVQDSHPALPERLGAMGASAEPPPALRAPAVGLLDAEPERPLIQALMTDPIPIQVLRWEDVGESLRVPILRAELEPYRAVLAQVSPASLVDIVTRPEPWLERVQPFLEVARLQEDADARAAWKARASAWEAPPSTPT